MVDADTLQELAREHGTPLFVVDHDELRAQLRHVQARICRACRPITP